MLGNAKASLHFLLISINTKIYLLLLRETGKVPKISKLSFSIGPSTVLGRGGVVRRCLGDQLRHECLISMYSFGQKYRSRNLIYVLFTPKYPPTGKSCAFMRRNETDTIYFDCGVGTCLPFGIKCDREDNQDLDNAAR